MKISIEPMDGVSWYILTKPAILDEYCDTRTVILVRRSLTHRYFRRLAHMHFHAMYGVYVVSATPLTMVGPVEFCETRASAEAVLRKLAIATYRTSWCMRSSWLMWKVLRDTEDNLELMT